MAERQLIADKLGVQIGKITNWFRNLRQSVRRGKLLDVKLTSTRGTTVDSKEEEEEEEEEEFDLQKEEGHEMEVDEEGALSHSDEEVRASPVPAPRSIVPGKGAYSTHSLIAASEYAALQSHSLPGIYVEDDDEEDEEEAHEAVTPHPSPESKLAHSFGRAASTLNTNTSDNLLVSPSPSHGIRLPSIHATFAQSEEKKQHQQEQKYHSAVEDAMLLLHFRQNCDVKDIHHGVVVGRSSLPSMY
jgi:hypothetical protein